MFLFPQLKLKHREPARKIGEQLERIIQGLRDGVGIELSPAETEFKEMVNFYICCVCC